MAYELTGKIKLIQDPQTFNSGFSKREMVVVVEDGKYPQEINIEFVQDKISLLDDLSAGQQVTVTFDIRGREYNGRYFNNLQGWKVSAQDSDSPSSGASYPSAGPSDLDPPMYDDKYIPF